MAHKPHKRKSPGFAPDGTSVQMEDYQKQIVEEGVNEVSKWISSVTGAALSEDIDTFFETIQNGVLLATLIKIVSPQHAFKFKDNAPKGSFFARQNVNDFCTACKNIGVPEVSLFESNDLIERRSDVRVIGCLKSLFEMFSPQKAALAADAEKASDEDTKMMEVEETYTPEVSIDENMRARKQQKTEEKVYQFTITKRSFETRHAAENFSFPIEILKKPEERKHQAKDSVKEALEKEGSEDNPVVKFLRKKSFISKVVLKEFQKYIKNKVERARKGDEALISLCKTDEGHILFYKPQPDWFFYYPVAKTTAQEIHEEKSSDEYRVVAVQAE